MAIYEPQLEWQRLKYRTITDMLTWNFIAMKFCQATICISPRRSHCILLLKKLQDTYGILLQIKIMNAQIWYILQNPICLSSDCHVTNETTLQQQSPKVQHYYITVLLYYYITISKSESFSFTSNPISLSLQDTSWCCSSISSVFQMDIFQELTEFNFVGMKKCVFIFEHVNI